VRLAELMGVSFASVNRWENGQARPNSLAWRKIERVELMGYNALQEMPLAGDEKIFMAGLYIREMLVRGLIRRILIAVPGNSLYTWEREMRLQFNLSFRIFAGIDPNEVNPFKQANSDLMIANLDLLADDAIFALLREPGVEPYDVAILDEPDAEYAPNGSHSAVDRVGRHQVAEAFAGIRIKDKRWRLPWRARHLLLLSAHMNRNIGD